MSTRRRPARPSLGVACFVLLVALSVVAFTVTRAVRSADDIVNAVELSKSLVPGGRATVSFDLTEADSTADVLIIDGRTDKRVRALKAGATLGVGTHELTWDGRDDDGHPVAAGLYALRVVLGEQGRDILPPGRIRVLGGGAGD